MHLREGGRGKGFDLDIQLSHPRSQLFCQYRFYLLPGQGIGMAAQLMHGLGQDRRQEVFAQQGKHLPDLDVGALEFPKFGDQAACLAAGKFGILALITAPPEYLLYRAINGECATGANTGEGGSNSARHGAALQSFGFTTHAVFHLGEI